jgi:hypothetical protein
MRLCEQSDEKRDFVRPAEQSEEKRDFVRLWDESEEKRGLVRPSNRSTEQGRLVIRRSTADDSTVLDLKNEIQRTQPPIQVSAIRLIEIPDLN